MAGPRTPPELSWKVQFMRLNAATPLRAIAPPPFCPCNSPRPLLPLNAHCSSSGIGIKAASTRLLCVWAQQALERKVPYSQSAPGTCRPSAGARRLPRCLPCCPQKWCSPPPDCSCLWKTISARRSGCILQGYELLGKLTVGGSFKATACGTAVRTHLLKAAPPMPSIAWLLVKLLPAITRLFMVSNQSAPPPLPLDVHPTKLHKRYERAL